MSPREVSFAPGYMTNVMAENDLILYLSGREVPEQTQGLTEDMTNQQEEKEIAFVIL